jgi:hypothetical protein
VGELSASRPGSAWRVEREANDFAAELLIPESLGAPLCRMPAPCLDDVERLARTFKTSPEMSAIRFVQLASAPCAAVFVEAGRVRWAAESVTFSAKIVRGRSAEEAASHRWVERLALPSGELLWVRGDRRSVR